MSKEGLTLELLAFKILYGGQFKISTWLIKTLVKRPPEDYVKNDFFLVGPLVLMIK